MAPVPMAARARIAVSVSTVNREQQPGPSCRRRPSKLLLSCEPVEPAVPWVSDQCWCRLYQQIEHR